MKQSSYPNLTKIVLIALILLLMGHNFVLQRTHTNASRTLTIRGDTDHYVSMIEGNWSTADAPFRFRILVPLIASILPLPPIESLRYISYVSLFLSYIFILVCCTKLNINKDHSVIGLLAVWASTFHLYSYHNPYLTDALGLLIICIMIFALFNNNFYLFLTAATIGCLVRETTIFLVPVWFIKDDWRRSILVVIFSATIILIPRYILASETDATLLTALYGSGVIQQPLLVIKKAFLSWGYIWFLSFIGIWYVKNDTFPAVVITYASLLCCAIFTSLIATDTGRMFSILAPILALTCARLYSELIEQQKHLMAMVFVGLFILQALVSIPNIFFGEGNWIFHLPRKALFGLEIVYIATVLHTLSSSLKQQANRKTVYIYEKIQRLFIQMKHNT